MRWKAMTTFLGLALLTIGLAGMAGSASATHGCEDAAPLVVEACAFDDHEDEHTLASVDIKESEGRSNDLHVYADSHQEENTSYFWGGWDCEGTCWETSAGADQKAVMWHSIDVEVDQQDYPDDRERTEVNVDLVASTVLPGTPVTDRTTVFFAWGMLTYSQTVEDGECTEEAYLRILSFSHEAIPDLPGYVQLVEPQDCTATIPQVTEEGLDYWSLPSPWGQAP